MKDKKIRFLEEENRKLKILIKSQLDTSDKLRVETFSTVEALRSEFEYLISDLKMPEGKR